MSYWYSQTISPKVSMSLSHTHGGTLRPVFSASIPTQLCRRGRITEASILASEVVTNPPTPPLFFNSILQSLPSLRSVFSGGSEIVTNHHAALASAATRARCRSIAEWLGARGWGLVGGGGGLFGPVASGAAAAADLEREIMEAAMAELSEVS
jgi:hypothetical protein